MYHHAENWNKNSNLEIPPASWLTKSGGCCAQFPLPPTMEILSDLLWPPLPIQRSGRWANLKTNLSPSTEFDHYTAEFYLNHTGKQMPIQLQTLLYKKILAPELDFLQYFHPFVTHSRSYNQKCHILCSIIT